MATTPKADQPAPSTPSASTLGPLEAAVALTAIAAVVLLAGISMWFYGTGGETSTVAVLGASLGTIGSIVGAVVGVGMGTKSGSATGNAANSAADAKTKLAKSGTKTAEAALTRALTASGGGPPSGRAAPAARALNADEMRELNEALERVRDIRDSL